MGLSQGAIASIDRDVFLERISPHSQALIRFTRELVRDKCRLMMRFDETCSGKVEARLAALLLRMTAREGQREENGALRLSLPLSRQDLADLVDTTVESAIRVMSRWNHEGLVLTDRYGFLISNPHRLAEYLLQ
jgi:CRP/FNR family transcriptional regulator